MIIDILLNDYFRRPTGKSAEEQVRPLVINKLKWQIKMYERQIQFHKQQLEVTLAIKC